MTNILTDAEIDQLIHESKVLPENFRTDIKLKPKRGHKEAELLVSGPTGSSFRLIVRQSNLDPFDFSVIIGYEIPGTNAVFRLRRYNGKSHEHTNKLEKQTFFAYHIHQATQRYQESGLTEDAFAEVTNRYADFQAAFECALNDCGFVLPPNHQPPLPVEGGNK